MTEKSEIEARQEADAGLKSKTAHFIRLKEMKLNYNVTVILLVLLTMSVAFKTFVLRFSQLLGP